VFENDLIELDADDTTRARQLTARLLAVFVLVVDDVDDIAIWRTDEKPAHSPRLRGQRVNDLEAALLSLRVCRLDLIAHMYRDHRVDRRRCISCNQLDDRAAVWRLKVDDPAEVESFNAETEKPT
jgi:hypothetical protein